MAQKWGTDEVVVSCLEREGLGELSLIAKEEGLGGPSLFALFNETKKDNGTCKSDCNHLGITAGGLQIKLKGRLAILFG